MNRSYFLVPSMTRWVGAMVLMLFAAGYAEPVQAQPLKDLNLIINRDWPVRAGSFYRIKFQVVDTSTAVRNSDRRFFFVVDPDETSSKVAKEVVLPGGQRRVEGEVFVPIEASWGLALNCHLEADGDLTKGRQELLSCRIDLQQLTQGQGDGRGTVFVNSAVKSTERSVLSQKFGRGVERRISYSVPEKGFPELKSIGTLADPYGNFSNFGTNQITLSNPGLHAIAPGDLPKNWIGLSSLSFLVIPESDFDSVFQNQKVEFEAIRKWIAVGGCVIVHSCEPSLANIEKFRRRLVGPTRQLPPWKLRSISAGRNGRIRVSSKERQEIVGSSATGELSDEESRGLKSGAIAAQLAIGNGNLVFTASNLEAGSDFSWAQFASLDRSEFFALDYNERFNNEFGVPGVGQPPILLFVILTIVFVMLIGPVTYVTLRRQKRIPLMFFVVPAVSLMACFGIVFFSLMYEGIYPKGRVVSLTDIDSKTGTSVTRTVQTYYSVFQPSAYSFPEEEMVRVAPTSRDWLYEQNEATLVSGGLIRSRAAHQFEVIQVDRCNVGILVENVDGQVFIQNNLGADILYLLAYVNGREVFLENVAAEARVPIGPAEIGGATTSFKRAMRELSPSVDYTAYQSTYGYSRIRASMGMTSNPESDWRDPRNISDYLGGTSSQLVSAGQYVAAVEGWDAFEINRPKENVQYRGSVHLVRGELQ